MGPDIELKVKSEAAMEVLVNKENIPTPPFSGQKVLQFGTNYNGNDYGKEASSMEQTPLSNRNEDIEVNITGGTNSGKALMVEDTFEDATECSSSFGDTGSGTENDSVLSDDEVVSQLYADPSKFHQWCEPSLIRKKKLTPHWMRFIRPVRWRIKWMELKMKQLQSQALRYEKELAAIDYRKKHEYANFTLDGCDTKTVPFSGQFGKKKVMKRKKRKRVEETCNLASYMSDHSLFSYYENKNTFADARLNDDVSGVAKGNADNDGKIKLSDILSSLEYKESDKSLVNSIQMFEAVQSEQSRVHKLKTRLDKVVSENQGKFCPVNNLIMLEPSDSLAGNRNTFAARNQFMEKSKESVEEPKSTSLVIKNDVVPKVEPTLQACSVFKSNNVPRSTRSRRVNSGSKRRSKR